MPCFIFERVLNAASNEDGFLDSPIPDITSGSPRMKASEAQSFKGSNICSVF